MNRFNADGFDSQKDQAVQDAQEKLEKELSGQFDTERKLKEQEVKAENSRLTKEIEILKRSLDEATRQVKEIAVKVIESGSQAKTQTTSES